MVSTGRPATLTQRVGVEEATNEQIRKRAFIELILDKEGLTDAASRIRRAHFLNKLEGEKIVDIAISLGINFEDVDAKVGSVLEDGISL